MKFAGMRNLIIFTENMSQKRGFRIEVTSRYAEWWRYNVALMCGCFNAADERTDFASASSDVADVGANLRERPAEVVPDRCIVLETPPCDHLILYVYIIPHTLPAENGIEASRPFEITLTAFRDGKRLRSEKRAINQWSGASIELRVP